MSPAAGSAGGTSGDATVRLKLDASQARAEFAKFLADARGATVGLGVSGGGGPGVPGGGSGGPGGGILRSVLGLGPVGLAAGALGGMFGAPIVGDALGGANGFLGESGHRVSEFLGLGDFNRASKVRGTARERTIEMLGFAGASASDATIKSLYDFNVGMEKFRNAATSNVERVIGKDDPVVDVLKQILDAIKNPQGAARSIVDAAAGAITGGMTAIGRSAH